MLKRLTNKQAFTLIEAMTAIAIIALIASMTMSSLHFYRQQLIAGEAHKLYFTIILLQHKTINNSLIKNYMTINSAEQTYGDGIITERLDKEVQFGFIPNTFGPPSNPTNPITSASTFKNNTIVFEPNGVISAGTLYLTDKAKNYMYAITIGVAKKTFIRLYKYKNNKWILMN